MRLSAFSSVIVAAFLAAPVSAAPIAADVPGVQSPIVKVYGGCGPYGHRGPYGGCRRGGQWGGWCPRGSHRGPYGGCRRNWY